MADADPIPELFEELVRTIRTRHLQTRLDRAIYVNPTADRRGTAEMLESMNLDFAPVLSEEDSHVVGFVSTRELRRSRSRTIDRHVQAATSPHLISADASLDQLLKCLQTSDFLLVLEGNRISGLVTPADLDRQAARAYFYALLVDFEVACAEMVRSLYPDQELAMALLPEDRGQLTRDRFVEAAKANVEADLVAYMNPADIIHVLGETPGVAERLGYPTASKWKKATGFVVHLRNDVMHPVRSLMAHNDVPRLIDRLARLKQLIDRLREAGPPRQ